MAKCSNAAANSPSPISQSPWPYRLRTTGGQAGPEACRAPSAANARPNAVNAARRLASESNPLVVLPFPEDDHRKPGVRPDDQLTAVTKPRLRRFVDTVIKPHRRIPRRRCGRMFLLSAPLPRLFSKNQGVAAMPTVAAIMEFLEAFAPPRLAADWDNVGLLLGERTADVERLMTCLTVTPEVAAEAVAERAQLIVTHHPILFRGVKRLTDATPEGRMLLALVRAGVAVYSPHTAFDNTRDGINDLLAAGSAWPTWCRSAARRGTPVVQDRRLRAGQRPGPRLRRAVRGRGRAHRPIQRVQFSPRGTPAPSSAPRRRNPPSDGRAAARRSANGGWRWSAPSARWRPSSPRCGRPIPTRSRLRRLSAAAAGVAVGRGPPRCACRRPGAAASWRKRSKAALVRGPVQLVGDPATAGAARGHRVRRRRRAAARRRAGRRRRVADRRDALPRLSGGQAQGLALVLPGHYATERFGVEDLARLLQQRWPDVRVWASRSESDPSQWL